MTMTLVAGTAALLFAAWLAERGTRAMDLARLSRIAPFAAAVLPGGALGLAAAADANAFHVLAALLGTIAAIAATRRAARRPESWRVERDAFLIRERALGMLTNALVVASAGAFLTESGATAAARSFGTAGAASAFVIVTVSSFAPSMGALAIATRLGRRAGRVAGLES